MYDVAELVEGYGLAESKHTRAVRQAMERLMQGIVRRLLGQMRKMITKSQGTHEEMKIFTKELGKDIIWRGYYPVLSYPLRPMVGPLAIHTHTDNNTKPLLDPGFSQARARWGGLACVSKK